MTTSTIQVLIVDDEPLARQRISDLLRHENGVEIAGTVDNGTAAVEAIRRIHPDVLFLDVQMPGMTGLDVARTIGADDLPTTIFVTAYDQHALQAFDVAALDYLVKPFDDERFEQAFRRARQRVSLQDARRLHERLLTVLQSTSGNGEVDGLSPRLPAELPPKGEAPAASERPIASPAATAAIPEYAVRIPVESRGRTRFIPVSEIDFIAASGPYAELVVGSRQHLIREAMQVLEERLDPSRFMRIHRSAIVQLDRVEALLKGPGGDYEVQLIDGKRLRVSRSRREELERRLAMAK